MKDKRIEPQMEQNLQESCEENRCEFYYGKYDSGFCSNKKSRFFQKECPSKGEQCDVYHCYFCKGVYKCNLERKGSPCNLFEEEYKKC